MSGAPPRQRLRHWLCLSCYRRPASADFCPLPAFGRAARRLRRQLRSRLRRLPQTQLVRCAQLYPGRSRVNRKRFNITAHYPKSASRYAWLRLVADRCAPSRVRVMVCYVLRPCAANFAIRRCAWFQLALRDRWSTFNRRAALPRLMARSLWPAAPAVSWWCRPASADFLMSADTEIASKLSESHQRTGQRCLDIRIMFVLQSFEGAPVHAFGFVAITVEDAGLPAQ